MTASPEQRTYYLTGFIGNPTYLVVLATGERAVWTPVWFADTADQQFDCTWLVMQPPEEVCGTYSCDIYLHIKIGNYTM